MLRTIFPAVTRHDVLMFIPKQMNLCLWKVAQAACVIQVQVVLNDVAQTFGFIPESLDLVECRFTDIASRAHHVQEDIHPFCGLKVILDAQPSIHQNHSQVGLNKHACNAVFHPWEIWTHCATVEKVDGHGLCFTIKKKCGSLDISGRIA